jgi:DNA repair exonuclease SbcCD nuclease subunit
MQMATPVLLATSDWHVDLNAWSDRREISGDSLSSLRQIVTHAISTGLPIVAAGDLLNQKPNFARLISALRKELDRLAEANIPLYFTQGQHELQEYPWLLAVHNWPTWIHNKTVELPCGLKLYGLDWQPRDRVADFLATVPADTDILVMHQVCHEFMGSITVPEMSVAQVPHAKILVVGDYHDHKVLNARGAQGQQLKVLSPGSTNMRKIDEPPAKKIFVVCGDLSVKSVRLKTRAVVKEEILNEFQLEEFIGSIRGTLKDALVAAKAPEAIEKPLVWAHYREDVPNAYARIEEAVGEWGHLFTKVLAATREGDEDAVEGEETYEAVEELGLVGCLPFMVNEAEEPDVYNLCHLLLSTDSPAAALASAREEFLRSEEGNPESE